jgi:hypothetical protein
LNIPLHEVEARQLLESEARRINARRILAIRQPRLIYPLVALGTPALGLFLMDAFVAPPPVKTMITFGVTGTLMWLIDSWFTHRRLDAAIELLLQSEDLSGNPRT